MKKIYKILTVVGTRPEIIKLSSVIKKFEKYFKNTIYKFSIIEIYHSKNIANNALIKVTKK